MHVLSGRHLNLSMLIITHSVLTFPLLSDTSKPHNCPYLRARANHKGAYASCRERRMRLFSLLTWSVSLANGAFLYCGPMLRCQVADDDKLVDMCQSTPMTSHSTYFALAEQKSD